MLTGHTICLSFWLQRHFAIIYSKEHNHLCLFLLLIISITITGHVTAQTCWEFHVWTSKQAWYCSEQLCRATQGPDFLLGNYDSFSLFMDSYNCQNGDYFYFTKGEHITWHFWGLSRLLQKWWKNNWSPLILAKMAWKVTNYFLLPTSPRSPWFFLEAFSFQSSLCFCELPRSLLTKSQPPESSLSQVLLLATKESELLQTWDPWCGLYPKEASDPIGWKFKCTERANSIMR